jgi:ubiquitin-protein ligase
MDEPQKIIKTETAKRLLKDIRQIIKHPLTDNGIYYSHDENDITRGYAMIVGPSDTPYFGGYYFFLFEYPDDYPFFPPKVTFMTNDGITRFNPNLYKNGKVCISILNTWDGEKWTSCQTINSILLTLCSLLNRTPFENEPNQNNKSIDFMPYQNAITYKNIDFAICDMIRPDKFYLQPSFEQFYPFMLQHFLNNYEHILSFVKSQPKWITTEHVISFDMLVVINYERLETKLIELKREIDQIES